MKTSVVTIGIVVVLAGTAGFLLAFANPRSHVSQPTPTSVSTTSQPRPQPQSSTPAINGAAAPTSSSSSQSMMGFQVYQDQSGFSFQYPLAWGSVVPRLGNRTKEGKLCPGDEYNPGPMAAPENVLISRIYDTEYSFSKAAIGPIALHTLTGIDKQPFISYCNEDGSGINTTEEQKDMRAQASSVALPDGDTAYESLNFFDAANDAQDYGADVDVDAVYILYHHGTRYEVSAGLTIPGGALQKTGCFIPESGDRSACAQTWLNNNPAAQSLQAVLASLRHMVATFRWNLLSRR
jgi:hypothetical protein